MQNKLSDVITKVQKLLRLAASSNHIGEVEAAQSLAQKYITEYQIEEAQLHGHTAEGDIVTKSVTISKPYALDKTILLSVIAKHNFCRVLRDRQSKNTCVIFGYASDIELVLAIYEVLAAHMISEMWVKLHREQIRETFGTPKTHIKTWIKSFFGGYAVSIGERIRISKEYAIKNTVSTGTSLEIIITEKENAVENYLEENIPYKKSTERELKSDAGYKAGIASAQTADIGQTKLGK